MYSVGPPETASAWPPLTEQEIVNALGVTVTGSLNVTRTLLSNATSFVLFAGSMAVTVGAVSPLLLRGFGAPTVKSAALLSVSAAPRSAAVVLLRVGVGAPSKSLAAVP